MSYVALYRKFRPANFDEVKGQDAIITTLKNQIKNQRTTHAYLFTGTRGTGKTSVAKILAKAVNCENPVEGNPCCVCPMCKSIQDGTGLNVIELDAASNNGVDSIRQIIDEVSYSPTEGKYKVYIIDEVHMLSGGAFNALLKTLEEPPSYVIFILATTEVHKIPITILSRCQRYDFRRISIDNIAGRIKELTDKEQVEIEDKAIKYIAKTADGSMRDALSLLDRCIAFYFGENLTYDKALEVLGAVDTQVFSKMLRAVLSGNVTLSLKILEEIIVQGRELTQFITDMTWYMRNLLLIKTAKENEDIIDLSSENMARIKEEAADIEEEVILRYIRILSELSSQLRFAVQKRIITEVTLIKLCRPQTQTDDESLVDRIRVLEKKVEQGVVVAKDDAFVPQNTQSESSVQVSRIVKALPEDIKQVASKWSVIVASLDEVFGKYLMGSYPSIKGEDTLAIIVKDEYSYRRFEESKRLEQLHDNIAQVTGKDIKISVILDGAAGSSDDVFPDIRKLMDEQIDFDIDVVSEDDSDEDDDYEYEDEERNEDDG